MPSVSYYRGKLGKVLKLRVKQVTVIRMVGMCGIISQFIGFIVLLVATSRSPWFSWTENYISVLGIRGSTSTLFNGGLMAVAIFSLIFAVGLKNGILWGKRLGQAGIVSLALGSCAIGAMGIFPRTTGIPHDCASVIFFAFIPLSLLFIGAAIVTSSEKLLGVLTLIAGTLMGVLGIALQLVPMPWSGGAIPQLLPCLPWSLWSIIFGTRLLIRPEQFTKATSSGNL
jgi:hypothetical membrane protein